MILRMKNFNILGVPPTFRGGGESRKINIDRGLPKTDGGRGDGGLVGQFADLRRRLARKRGGEVFLMGGC